MEKDKIKFYMEGCRLTIEIEDGTPDIYLLLQNTENEWHSDIYQYVNPITFELKLDGIYRVYIVKSHSATLEDNVLTIGHEEYDPFRLIRTFDSGLISVVDDYFSEEIFSICKLRKCLLNLQMKMFYNNLKNCGINKCKSDELRNQRDFLFIAVWLMEQLLEEGKDEKVREIYESLRTCKSICDDLTTVNNCGCNG